MSHIQAVLNEFMPCGGTVCPGCEVACTSGDGRTPDVDRMADALIEARAERDRLHVSLQFVRDALVIAEGQRDQLKAERIVPKVPVPVLREYKGVTYREGLWWHEGTAYEHAASVIAFVSTFTDDDHAALLDLKAHPTVTPPTRERVEPVAWANVYDGGMALYGNEADARCYANANALETAAPLYRHPATIDDAIALLVREGARYYRADQTDGKNARLILPTTGAAHE